MNVIECIILSGSDYGFGGLGFWELLYDVIMWLMMMLNVNKG